MRYVLTDTETGGFSPVDHGVCELAWIEVDDDLNIIDKFHSLVDPEKPISAGASGIHGILNEDVVDSPTLAEVMTVLRDLPFSVGPITFIAHNAKFDWAFLKDWFPSTATLMCTLRLARQVYPDAENHKLQTLRVLLGMGVNRGDAHSALGDTEVLLELLRQIKRDTGLSMAELSALATAPIAVEKIGFGKHKGTALRKLPADYVKWLLGPKGPENLDPDLKASLLAL